MLLTMTQKNCKIIAHQSECSWMGKTYASVRTPGKCPITSSDIYIVHQLQSLCEGCCDDELKHQGNNESCSKYLKSL